MQFHDDLCRFTRTVEVPHMFYFCENYREREWENEEVERESDNERGMCPKEGTRGRSRKERKIRKYTGLDFVSNDRNIKRKKYFSYDIHSNSIFCSSSSSRGTVIMSDSGQM